MILLDTTFLIDLLKGRKVAIGKFETLSFLTVFTTRINIFEVLVGVFSLKSDDAIEKTNACFKLFNSLNILELDEKAATKSAEVAAKLQKEGEPIGSADCLIAGIALSNGIDTIITKNTKHFNRIHEIKVERY